MNESVAYVSQGTFSHFCGYEVTVLVTETGRTYTIKNDPWSCYIVNGEAIGHAEHFIRWWKSLKAYDTRICSCE
jgi:hypothetical protein